MAPFPSHFFITAYPSGRQNKNFVAGMETTKGHIG